MMIYEECVNKATSDMLHRVGYPDTFTRPTHGQASRWLREEQGALINIDFSSDGGWEYQVTVDFDTEGGCILYRGGYLTYELANEAAIMAACNHIHRTQNS